MNKRTDKTRRLEQLHEQVLALRFTIIMMDQKTEFRIIENIQQKIDERIKMAEKIMEKHVC